jgi:murein DD-endopeptidase MepM/ murein hydrolase activator NlpD
MHRFHSVILIIVLGLCSARVFALEIKSEWIQGGMIIGSTLPGNTITFVGKNVRVNNNGDFVVGLHRNAKPKVVIIEKTPEGVAQQYEFMVKQRQYNEQRVNGVPKKTVDIPAEELPKIRQESKLVKAARKIDSELQSFLEEFLWPANGIVSGVYGSRRYYNGKPGRPHYGLDIAAPQGSPVMAPASGVVSLVHDNMYFSGGTIILDHGHGISSTFIHLHKIHVKEGDKIKQGQLIADIGSTGRSTGPHLHWSMNWFGNRTDPQLLMKGLPEKYKK